MHSRTIAIRPELCGVEQLDDGIDGTLVSSAQARFLFREAQSVRNRGQYQRPIALPRLFWPNRDS